METLTPVDQWMVRSNLETIRAGTPVDQWMVRSNLETIRAGTPVDEQVAILKANGYLKVAQAVKEAWEKEKR